MTARQASSFITPLLSGKRFGFQFAPFSVLFSTAGAAYLLRVAAAFVTSCHPHAIELHVLRVGESAVRLPDAVLDRRRLLLRSRYRR